MPQLISKEYCNGCEACANICPKDCISFFQNEEGFYYPQINDSRCIDCKQCEKICPLISDRLKFREIEYNDTIAYGIYHRDAKKVIKSSSGGLAEAIAENQIQQNGKVCGVLYQNNFRDVEYFIVDSMESFAPMRGSKYVLARKKMIYRKIKQELQKGCPVTFIGLPCEIGGLYAFLGKNYENLSTVELICAGTGSYKVHQDFLDLLEKQYSSSIKSFTYRHKKIGWVPYFVQCEFENGKRYKKSYSYSEVGIGITKFKRPSCFHCNFKGKRRIADITIGDFWTLSPNHPSYNHWGTSVAFARTTRGNGLLKKMSNIVLYPVEINLALRSNFQQLTCNCEINHDYAKYREILLNEGFESVSSKFAKKEPFLQRIVNLIPGNIYFLLKKTGYKILKH